MASAARAGGATAVVAVASHALVPGFATLATLELIEPAIERRADPAQLEPDDRDACHQADVDQIEPLP